MSAKLFMAIMSALFEISYERNLDEEMEDLGWVRKDSATLSAGTCHEVEDEDTGFIVCSECGAVHDADYTNYYCWGCGRKVVDE